VIDAVRELHRLARLLARLAPTRRGRAGTWLAVMSLPIRTRLRRSPGWLGTITIREAGQVHRFRITDYADAHALREVFVDRQYELRAARAPGVILDLGAHVGAATLFFRITFPEARILSVEPDPETFAKLKRNVGGLGGVELLPVAVGGVHGTGSVVRADLSWATRVVPGGTGPDTVPVRTLDELIAQVGGAPERTLVKLDVEGAEWDVLSRCDLRRLYGVIGEVHYDLLSVAPAEFHELFDGLEVEVEALTDRSAVFRVAAARS
jgi:FkbM family methyltransferase